MTTSVTEHQKKPENVHTFAEFSLPRLLAENLLRAHFVHPTPIQVAAIQPALNGGDILGTAETGTGKTLAFVLPILDRLLASRAQGIEALVLVPTRELALQVYDTIRVIGRGTGISVAVVVGGLSESRQLSAIREGARIVIATPGRLEDYLRRKLVNLQNIKILVLDEADHMVDMGFLPQMRNIMQHIPRQRQTMCFSATLDASVSHLVREYLKDPVRLEVGSASKPAHLVKLKIYEVVREQKLSLLMHLLHAEAGTFLVFTRTKFGADKLFKKLAARGIDATVLHGGKTQAQRTRALEGFKRGSHRVLVATDIAARGIHVAGIAHVINYDMPEAVENFIHRAGRTGRVEEEGTATTFVMPEETRDIFAIERKVGKQIERIPLPQNLSSEPRSLHDEASDMRNRRMHAGSTRHFGRRRRY